MIKTTNYIGTKILQDERLSLDEASLVYQDIQQLQATGVWSSPGWAVEIGNHLQTICTDNSVKITALMSVSRSFLLMIYKN